MKEPKLKSPMTAFGLSLLLSGMGLMWIGQWRKGVALLIGGIILSLILYYSIETIWWAIIMVIFWVLQALYAFQQTRKYNERKSLEYLAEIDNEDKVSANNKISIEHRYCINCGTQLPAEARYCSRCGQEVKS